MWKTTIKGLVAHKLRMALTALAVVLGVGFVAGTYVLTDTMTATFNNLFSDVTAGTDFYVRAKNEFESQQGGSRKPINGRLLPAVAKVEGVAMAAGSVGGYAQLVDDEGNAIQPGGAPTLGFNWTPEPMNPMDLRSGRPPESDEDVLIDAATAKRYDLEVGERVQVLSAVGSRGFTVSGIAGFGKADNLGGATAAIFSTSTAQELFDKEGRFDAIEVTTQRGMSREDVRERIEQIVPRGVQVTSATDVAEEQSRSLKDALGFFNTALLVFAGVALFVGAFIIFNTFSITVAQRIHEFGVLRALGASGGQVMASVFLEASIVGLVASAVGLGAGVLIALGLNAMLEAFGIDLPTSGLQLQTRTVIVSMLVGTLVTVVSAILPARRAARVSPMEALRVAAPRAARFSGRRTIAGLLVTGVGAAVLMFGLFGDPGQPVAVVGLGAFVVFLGVAMLAPLFAGALARAIGAPVARLSLTGKLAQRNAERNPRRTASTASALMIGLALVGFVSILAASLKASTNEVVDESLKADFALSPESTFAMPTISPQVARDISRREEIAAVAPIRMGQFRNEDGRALMVVGTDPQGLEQTADVEVTSGRLTSLADGGIFMFENTAEDLGLDVGDSYTMKFAATGTKREPVEGFFENKAMLSADYLLSLETFDENIPDTLDTSVLVKAAPGVSSDEARRALEDAVKPYPNVRVQDQTETKEQSARQVNQLLGLVSALLGLALVIALLGITNTLALSVFERTRELGLLRAVGMLRSQTRAMIRWESMIIALIGALLGTGIGTFFGWALVSALRSEGITELAIPAGQLAGYVIVAGVAGVVAALPPARRAARLNVLDAIASE